MKAFWTTGLMILTVLAGSALAGDIARSNQPGNRERPHRSSWGWDPIPRAMQDDGPFSPTRFWTDSTGQRWDMGYINYKPEYKEIVPCRPDTPRDRLVERSGKVLRLCAVSTPRFNEAK
jgi:hypothetical protein